MDIYKGITLLSHFLCYGDFAKLASRVQTLFYTSCKGNRKKKEKKFFFSGPATKAFTPPPRLSGRTTKIELFFAASLSCTNWSGKDFRL